MRARLLGALGINEGHIIPQQDGSVIAPQDYFGAQVCARVT